MIIKNTSISKYTKRLLMASVLFSPLIYSSSYAHCKAWHPHHCLENAVGPTTIRGTTSEPRKYYSRIEKNCHAMAEKKINWRRFGSRKNVLYASYKEKKFAPIKINYRQLCLNTKNPQRTINCFHKNTARSDNWQRAIKVCASKNKMQRVNSKAQVCYSRVQGKVAWNRKGNKKWSPNNVKRLCANTQKPRITISCFKSEIRKHDDWNRAINRCSAR